MFKLMDKKIITISHLIWANKFNGYAYHDSDHVFQIAQAHQNVLETQVKQLCEYISSPQDNRRQHGMYFHFSRPCGSGAS